MKAITLWQPWASLIATGAKKIETRSWPTKYRGPLAIHASQKWNDELSSMLCIWQIQGGLAPLIGKPLDLTGMSWPGVKDEHLPRGAIVAICNLVDCVPTDSMTQKQIEYEKYFGDFSPGRYAWILEDVKKVDIPIPAKGKQGLWEWGEGK
ncbi:MAG TPA: ASCH domain-containing protein [Bacteroidales bacterium]|nr:ASCH domain-containing protein [Bacteroidales bacterium]